MILPLIGNIFRRINRVSGGGQFKTLAIDANPPQDRGASVGLCMGMIALGFALGASLGGTLADGLGLFAMQSISVVLGCVNTAIAVFCVTAPKKVPPPVIADSVEAETVVKATKALSLPRRLLRKWSQTRFAFVMRAAVKDLDIGLAYTVRFLISVSFWVYVGTFDLFVTERFNLTATELGRVLSFVGIAFGFVTGVVVPFLLRQTALSQWNYLKWGMFVLAIGRVVLSQSPNFVVFLLANGMVSLGAGVVETMIPAILSSRCSLEDRGLYIGTLGAMEGIAGVFAPALSGTIYDTLGPGFPALMSGLMATFTLAVILSAQHVQRRRKARPSKYHRV